MVRQTIYHQAYLPLFLENKLVVLWTARNLNESGEANNVCDLSIRCVIEKSSSSAKNNNIMSAVSILY
jgi:hypothetical protein